jgi:hypothetical protein
MKSSLKIGKITNECQKWLPGGIYTGEFFLLVEDILIR